jgi:hypothetical protein
MSHTDYREYYAFLNRELTARISDLCLELLGESTLKKSDEWRYGNKGSLSVTISGPYQGRFYDFETGIHGGALDLITHIKALNGRDLCQWARNWLGIAKDINWQPVMPVPSTAPHPDFTKSPLSYLMEGRYVGALYPYRDFEGSLLGYVVRLVDQRGQKITPMLTFWTTNTGRASWRWKGFGDYRLPYGAENLKDTTKPVLIVEGEKTVEAAKRRFPNYTVLTWSGGAKNVLKTEWSCLKERDVVIFPDNDAAGLEAAHTLRDHLLTLGVAKTGIFQIPKGTPPKWDLADPIPSPWISQFLEKMIKTAINNKEHEA